MRILKYLGRKQPAVWALTFLTLSGCGPPKPRYFICMANRTPRDIGGVDVYFNGKWAAGGGGVPGGEATYGYVTLPIPAEAEVRWEYEGVKHAPKVSLRGIVPDNPTDVIIYFIIEEDDSVTVKCLQHNDIDGRVEATKGIEKFIQKDRK